MIAKATHDQCTSSIQTRMFWPPQGTYPLAHLSLLAERQLLFSSSKTLPQTMKAIDNHDNDAFDDTVAY
jgi:hypothetical protein